MTLPADNPLLDRLRAGDEAAFTMLVDAYGNTMLHVARRYVKERASAEEIVQETWLAVLQGLHRFEGRSSLKSWIFSILVKRAITRGKRDSRVLPFSNFAADELSIREPAVSPDRFAGPDAQWPRHWVTDVVPWAELPEQQLLARETRAMLEGAIAELPLAQRTVVVLRDIVGQSADEVAEQLSLSSGNVRVLLHRGRSKLRQSLETYLTGEGDPALLTPATIRQPEKTTDSVSHSTSDSLMRRLPLSWLKNLTVKIWSKWSPIISRMAWTPRNADVYGSISWNATAASNISRKLKRRCVY